MERFRSIAVISGKGGSGKTMVTAVIADVLSSTYPGDSVIVMDADTGTAGLTFYLGLKLVRNIRVGLSNFNMEMPNIDIPNFFEKNLQVIQEMSGTRFFGIGDLRRLEKSYHEDIFPKLLSEAIHWLHGEGSQKWLVVDCRGGIDRESIAVCQSVDDIIIIAEADTTSFQATKHVVDVLSDHDLAHKMRGFIINKVFDDPSVVVRNGTSVFGTQFLAAIPFDLKATRSFLVGDIPDLDTPFSIHVWLALSKAYPDSILQPPKRTWTFEEFKDVGLTNFDSIRGGNFAATLILLSFFMYLVRLSFEQGYILPSFPYFIFNTVVGLLACFESTRRIMGRALIAYLDFIRTSIRFLKRPSSRRKY